LAADGVDPVPGLLRASRRAIETLAKRMPAAAARRDERARLLARIRREFDVVEESVVLSGRALAFARIADPDALLGEVCDEVSLSEQGVAPRRELRLPYWAAVWESATALAEYLVDRDAGQPLAGKAVLDLGCGMGLVGAAAAMLGARVTLADIDTAGLLFARLNTLAWASRTRVVRCDWHVSDLGAPFDLIAAADVVYDQEQWRPIEAFARRHLGEEGVLLLSEPSRPAADAFAAWLETMGWQVASSTRPEGDKTVRIHEAWLRGPAPHAAS
jgi:predicted nicotinamide N-methyase